MKALMDFITDNPRISLFIGLGALVFILASQRPRVMFDKQGRPIIPKSQSVQLAEIQATVDLARVDAQRYSDRLNLIGSKERNRMNFKTAKEGEKTRRQAVYRMAQSQDLQTNRQAETQQRLAQLQYDIEHERNIAGGILGFFDFLF